MNPEIDFVPPPEPAHPPPAETDDGVRARIVEAFEESTMLSDSVMAVFKGDSGEWLISYTSGSKVFRCIAVPKDDGFEFIPSEIPRLPPFAGGGLLMPESSTVAELMGIEIQKALGDVPTPESCEQVIAMTTAARDFLSAQQMGQHRWPTPLENIQKLAEVFGAGARDEDPFP